MKCHKSRVLIIFLVVIALGALTFPRWHVLAGPRIYCSIIELDVNTARLRNTTYVLYVPVRQSETETHFSSEMSRLKLSNEDSKWIEASVRAGLGDYYPRPHGGGLLSRACPKSAHRIQGVRANLDS